MGVGLRVSHDTNGTAATNLGAGISFEIKDLGGVEEQGRISTIMDTVTDGREDSRIVFMVQDNGTLTAKADVQKTRFNIASLSSYAINNDDVLSATGLGSNVVSSSLTSVGTLTGLTVNGNVTVSSGGNDFDMASHNGTYGLKLGGVLVSRSAADINALVTAGGTGLTKSGSTLSVDTSQTQITEVGTLSELTVNGDVTVSSGGNDFDIASHNGTYGLKLGGVLVTSSAAQLNYLDIESLGTSQANKVVTADSDGVVKLGLLSTDTNADRVGLTVSHDTNGTAATNLGAGISFEIKDLGGVEEQGRVSTVMDTVTDGSEDSRIVFMVQSSGTLTAKADVQKTRFNIASSSSYAINNDDVLSATGLGNNVVSSSLTSVGTLTGLTVNGDVTVSNGGNDFDVASHDGTNGLKLGGVLVEATAADINKVKSGTRLATIAGLTCSLAGEVLEWSGSTWQCGTDNTRRRLGNGRAEGVNGYSSTADGGTFFSDRRLKSGIQTIRNATEKLQKLRGVLYEFKNQDDVKHVKNLPRGVQIGVIAQEVDEVLPQIVKTSKDGIKLVDYAALSGFLVQVNKEQQLALTQQKEVNKEQELALTQQKAALAQQESHLYRIADMLHEERNERHYDRIIFACVLLAICLAMWMQKRQIDSLQSSKVCTGSKVYTRIATKPV